MQFVSDITQLIGRTPLVALNKLSGEVGARVIVKLENNNPCSSVKDRIALSMLNDAEQKGLIDSDTIIIEPTSGNTGIGLAFIAATRKYRIILTMPETMSVERRAFLNALGAELVLTPGDDGMAGAVNKAEEILESTSKAYMPNQFKNPANPLIHRTTTGPEIWEDLDGKIDIFVSAIGTGGTITGVGEYLKEKNQSIQIYGIEPEDSPFLTRGIKGPHKIQGIGAGFKPDILNLDIIDEILTVTSEEAIESSRRLAKEEGIFAGISSGANVAIALKLAARKENKNKIIVTIICDTGERYLSTPIYMDI